MKLSLLLLTAFAGSALASVIAEAGQARDLTTDADILSRDLANPIDVDLRRSESESRELEVEVRDDELIDIDIGRRSDNFDELEARQNPSVNRRCPSRRQSTPWIRRGNFPFSTTRIIGFFFDFHGFDTTVVFFLFNSRTNDFFYTTDRSERRNALSNLGYQDRGTIGFIFIDSSCGGTPLFRMFNSRTGTHFYTTSQMERGAARRSGWNDEGVTGWLFGGM
ncbi:hypothetical protein FPV67DRAFT_254271 [Lyophyllum atratum]|nr:hypothetical protein FPV67DRAFT_254271 [Lyophyllum atratum]